MSSMFKTPKQQPVAPSTEVIPAPSRTADEVQTLAASQKSQYTSANSGRASTLLTGGQGTTGGYASAASLLGQVGR